MEHKTNIELLRTEIGRLVDLLHDADLGAPVGTCPGWDVAELVRHVGKAHRWARQIVVSRAESFLSFKSVPLDTPDVVQHLPAWLAAGGEPLLAAFDDDPSTPVWSWVPPGSIGYWARRMLHETTVHRADVELALGDDPVVDAEVAVDGIAEFLELLTISKAPARLADLGRAGDSLHLRAADGGGAWILTLTEDGFACSTEHRAATATVRGTAADLLLLLWNRRPLGPDRFETFGDRELIEAWLAASTI
jgi:uncharacterized protein (TIGR03083 family)